MASPSLLGAEPGLATSLAEPKAKLKRGTRVHGVWVFKTAMAGPCGTCMACAPAQAHPVSGLRGEDPGPRGAVGRRPRHGPRPSAFRPGPAPPPRPPSMLPRRRDLRRGGYPASWGLGRGRRRNAPVEKEIFCICSCELLFFQTPLAQQEAARFPSPQTRGRAAGGLTEARAAPLTPPPPPQPLWPGLRF